MGRIFSIQYDQTPDSRIYLCKTCRTHLALWPETVSVIADNASLLLEKAVNVMVDPPEDYYLDKIFGIVIVASNLHCVACNMLLGQKLIQVNPSNDTFREGRLMLKLWKLLFWNGQQMVELVTMYPLEPQEDS